jgi:hypothetical protein
MALFQLTTTQYMQKLVDIKMGIYCFIISKLKLGKNPINMV